MARRVAVIGGGSSGLTCIKCCLDEGLEPVCFESSDDIGGLWRFKEDPENDRASIYQSVIINTSKEMMCFSDFPIPAHFPNYMHNSLIMDYFRMYAEHFKLLRYVRLQMKHQDHISAIEELCIMCEGKNPLKYGKARQPLSPLSLKDTKSSQSGQWDVVTKNRQGQEERHIFDAVFVCMGHHVYPHIPVEDFPGIETFKGKWFHSRDYKSPEEWLGKRVVVIGIGNSGGDIAVEFSRVAKQVFLSTRRGSWIVNRVGENGFPLDMRFSRLMHMLTAILPITLLSTIGEKRLNMRFNHKLYSIKPKHRLFSQHPTINDELPNRILSGRVLVKTNVSRIEGSSVMFEDGTVEEDIDLVVFATGYTFSFPFLPSSVISVSENKTSLYKYVFPPTLDRPTLAIIGLVQPLGAIMPISEMQARWATRIFKGLNKLPPVNKMLKDIKVTKEKMDKRYVTSQRHTIQVDFLHYMDDLAGQFGVRPKLLRLLLLDPRLGLSVLFGPCTPYQYRLYGPGQWAGARQAILTQWERVAQPMKTRAVPEPPSSRLPLLLALSGAVLVVAAVCSRKKFPDLLASLSNWRMYMPKTFLHMV